MDAARDKELNNLIKAYNMLLYFSGSMIMYEPNEECILDFFSNDILKTLPVKSSNPRFIKAASQLRNVCEDKTICLKVIQDDYRRLFGDNGQSLVPVYESFYTGKAMPGVKAQNETVTEFFESYGWHSKQRGRKPDDHLGTEILFLTALTDKLITFDDSVCRTEMKKEIRRFIENHIFTWVPEWSEMIQAYSNTMSYKSIATLILACSEDIYRLCDNNEQKQGFPELFRN
jgi:TorA maturation chaperone TorD